MFVMTVYLLSGESFTISGRNYFALLIEADLMAGEDFDRLETTEEV